MATKFAAAGWLEALLIGTQITCLPQDLPDTQIGPANQPMMWQTGTSHTYFKNNIWYMGSGQATYSLETYQGATASFDHDLFYNGSAPGGGGITVTGLLTADPQFVNTAGFDFHLQPGSPAVNAGVSTVNTVVTTDYDGKPRPQGTAYDVGAYEYIP